MLRVCPRTLALKRVYAHPLLLDLRATGLWRGEVLLVSGEEGVTRALDLETGAVSTRMLSAEELRQVLGEPIAPPANLSSTRGDWVTVEGGRVRGLMRLGEKLLAGGRTDRGAELAIFERGALHHRVVIPTQEPTTVAALCGALPGDLSGSRELRHTISPPDRARPGRWKPPTQAEDGAFADVTAWCMFVGHPRSGHSLVGSLLNAHPEVVISHELDALRLVAARVERRFLFEQVLAMERRFAEGKRRSGEYNLTVPGQWQGRSQRLRVIGDKKGDYSSVRLLRRPELFDQLRQLVEVPVQVVHVVRNPLDNIATMFRKGDASHSDRARRSSLADAVADYFSLCEVCLRLMAATPGRFLSVHLEALIEQPGSTLEALCAHLGVSCSQEYQEACAGILFPSPRRSRDTAPWTPELIREVEERSRRFGFLSRYRLER